MRKEDVRLLAAARQGDEGALCEAGRRYLLGTPGFSRHPTLGIEYLTHPAVNGTLRAAIVIAECLPLHEIVSLGQIAALRLAARALSVDALIKLGLSACLTSADLSEAVAWFEKAAAAGSDAAQAALRASQQRPQQTVGAVLRALGAESCICPEVLLTQALVSTPQKDDAVLLSRLLDAAVSLRVRATAELRDAACAALARAQALPGFCFSGSPEGLECLLEDGVKRGNADAALLLGRALCGLDAGALRASTMTTGQNMRKGAALLMRAADAGRHGAWMLLYRVHSDHGASVANPQMALFFLEKAAIGGDATARRLLGALILRSASHLHETEQAIHWLHEAACSADDHARGLLRTLVLPVAGDEVDAAAVIEAIRRQDPWTALRLRTARDFGLTKLEALSVDILNGARPWGLVVGTNPFVTQAKLAAPRAVPAVTPQAAAHLRRSVAFLDQAKQEGLAFEGDLRKRSVRLRRLLAGHAVNEELFFAAARSTTLQTLRQGTKWAFQERHLVRMALTA